MVWLHGGGYTSGSGGFLCYSGQELARKHDVVVVTVNHRLTVFGYLYLAGIGGEKFAHASNVGMLDIVAALEWVRDNAAAFGGDSGNVTIFGQSGGGGKVSVLMAMPSAKGLFHRAIVESGANVKGVPRGSCQQVGRSVPGEAGAQARPGRSAADAFDGSVAGGSMLGRRLPGAPGTGSRTGRRTARRFRRTRSIPQRLRCPRIFRC